MQKLAWWGEFSGHGVKGSLVSEILPQFEGTADIIFCFEGGEFYEGYRVSEGRVVEHDVVIALGQPRQ